MRHLKNNLFYENESKSLKNFNRSLVLQGLKGTLFNMLLLI